MYFGERSHGTSTSLAATCSDRRVKGVTRHAPKCQYLVPNIIRGAVWALFPERCVWADRVQARVASLEWRGECSSTPIAPRMGYLSLRVQGARARLRVLNVHVSLIVKALPVRAPPRAGCSVREGSSRQSLGSPCRASHSAPSKTSRFLGF